VGRFTRSSGYLQRNYELTLSFRVYRPNGKHDEMIRGHHVLMTSLYHKGGMVKFNTQSEKLDISC